MSAKYEHLVNKGGELIKVLPWGEKFEVDSFTKPDFTGESLLSFFWAFPPCTMRVDVDARIELG
jgi:hypothetical protein